MKYIAVVPAAGIGQRMGAEQPKQYLSLGNQSILEHSVYALLAGDWIERVYVAVQADDPYFSHLAIARDPRVVRVDGGPTRAQSVLNALDVALAAWPAETLVAVHDAARPGLSLQVLNALFQQAEQSPEQGVLAALPAWDTMKVSDGGKVKSTFDRRHLWHACTPQIFTLERLYKAIQGALQHGVAITDEASAMEWAGYTPVLVQAEQQLRKITCPEDLVMVSALLAFNKRESV